MRSCSIRRWLLIWQVVFARVADAAKAQGALDGKTVRNMTITVKFSKDVLKAKVAARKARFEGVAGATRDAVARVSRAGNAIRKAPSRRGPAPGRSRRR